MSMRTLTTTAANELRAKSTASAGLESILSFLGRCLRVRSERRRLMGLDDRMLKDIGLSRGEAYAEASRSMFDLPAEGRRRTL